MPLLEQKTKAGRVLEFASAEEDKALAALDKAVNAGNAHEAKAYAESLLLWRTVRDHAYREASEHERVEWRRKQHGDGT